MAHKQMTLRALNACFQNMRARCHKPGTRKYEYYGGRGITVCDEWRNNWHAFRDWALNNGWEPGLQIDRLDNSKGYSPGNCRWVTRQENLARREVTPRWANASRNNLLFVNKEYRKWRTQLSCSRSVVNLTLNKAFPSIQAAAKASGLAHCTISAALHGRLRTAGGCEWRFA